MEELKKAEIWQIYVGAETYEKFCQNVAPPLPVKPEVPELIREELRVVHQLLKHSYFEYRFIDVAVLHATFILEKALKQRYFEIEGKEWKKNFEILTKEFTSRGFFEFKTAQEILDAYRKLRNEKVHNVKESILGLPFINSIYKITFLINDLYEEVELRKVREQAEFDLNARIAALVSGGAVAELDGGKFLIFDAHVVFLNNKRRLPKLHLVVWPIFDPRPYLEGKHFCPHQYYLKLENFAFTDSGDFEGVNLKSGKVIKIFKCSKEENKHKFLSWEEGIKKIKDLSIIDFTRSIKMQTYQTEALDEFYRE